MGRKFQLVPRSAWNAELPKGIDPLPYAQALGVAIHYSASGSPIHHRDCYAAVKEIQRFHMETRGWLDIAYSHIVCPHGFTFRCRGIGVRTAANGTNESNSHYYAVCYLGTDRDGRKDFTDAAKIEIAWLLNQLYMPKIGRNMRVRPHSDFTSTECPGDEIRAWIKWQRWLSPSKALVPPG